MECSRFANLLLVVIYIEEPRKLTEIVFSFFRWIKDNDDKSFRD